MKRCNAVLLLLLSFTFLGSASAFGESCPPRGSVIIGPTGYFDHIANGDPASASCWTLTNATFVSNLPACTPLGPPPYNAFQLNYGSSVVQQFTIPLGMTGTRIDLAFQLDFVDPNHDPFNAVSAQVWDLTAGQFLGYFDYDGSRQTGGQPDVNFTCRRIDIGIDQQLAGHIIQVRFSGQKGYANTFIRVHGISFFQLPPINP